MQFVPNGGAKDKDHDENLQSSHYIPKAGRRSIDTALPLQAEIMIEV